MISWSQNFDSNSCLNSVNFAKDAYNDTQKEINNLDNKEVRDTFKIFDHRKECIVLWMKKEGYDNSS